MYLTEFGFDCKGESRMSVQQAVKDDDRILYFREAMEALRRAVKDGADLRGCFAWSKTLTV